MFNKGYRIRNYDFKLILLILALSTIGVFAVGSAQPSVQQKQLLGVIAGTFLMVVISLFDYTVFLKLLAKYTEFIHFCFLYIYCYF